MAKMERTDRLDQVKNCLRLFPWHASVDIYIVWVRCKHDIRNIDTRTVVMLQADFLHGIELDSAFSRFEVFKCPAAVLIPLVRGASSYR